MDSLLSHEQHGSHHKNTSWNPLLCERIEYVKKNTYPLKSFYIDILHKWTSSAPTRTSTLKETPKRFAVTANSLEMIYVVLNKSHTRSLKMSSCVLHKLLKLGITVEGINVWISISMA